MNKFQINKFIELKLEDGKTNIYVSSQYFRQSKYILLRKTLFEIEDEGILNIESVDELAEKLDHSLKQKLPEVIDISAETQFWVHCSNMQAWAEHDYDSKMLHSNLSFPLLRRLAEVGDLKALWVFKDEIAERFASRHEPVSLFLISEGYLNFFNDEELLTLAELNREIFEDNLMYVRKEFVYFYLGSDGKILERLEKKYNTPFTPVSKSTFLELIEKNIFFVENRKIAKINLSDLHIKTIPHEIFRFKSLDALSVSYCALVRVPRAISRLRNLKTLALNSNSLQIVPESIGQLKALEVLYLGYNELKSLPETLFNLENLEILHLGNNELTHIPEEIGKLKNLKSLHLYCNKLTSLPVSLGKLHDLKYLLIYNNLLTSLPENIIHLDSLKVISLEGNEFKDLDFISKVVSCLRQKNAKVYFKTN